MKKIIQKAAILLILLIGSTNINAQNLAIDTVFNSNISCYGADDGIIRIIATGGTLSYEYSIDSASSFQTDSIFANLPANEYKIAIRDANDTIYYSTSVVLTQPTAVDVELGNDIQACDGYMLNVSGDYNTYSWSNGATTSSILITQTGTYYVSVTDDEGGCGFDSVNITVNTTPVNNMPNLVAFCEGGSVELSANGGSSYLWSTEETTANITVSPETNQTYFVTVTENNCYSTDSVLVELHEFHNQIVADPTVCQGENLDLVVLSYFDNNIVSTSVNHLWSFGSSEDTVSIFPDASSYCSVTSSYIDGCISTDTLQFEVLQKPVVTIVDTQTICSSGTATINATGGDSYIWNTGETTSSISVTPSSDSTYTVTVSLDNGCSITTNSTVQISNNNIADAGEDNIVCAGNEITVNAYGGDTFTWVSGTDTVSTTQDLTISPINSRDYIVYVESGSCTDSDTVTINVYDLPVVDLGDEEQNVCEGTLLVLTPTQTSELYTYLWSTNETTSQISVSESSTISLTVTDEHGCIGESNEVNVSITEIPELSIEGQTIVCSGQTTQLVVSGAENYLWDNGETDSSIIVTPTDTTTYSVYGFVNGCYSNASIEVYYLDIAAPELSFEDTVTICGSGYLDAGTGFASYLWSNGSTDSQIYIDSTNYYGITVSNDGGCIASNDIFARVMEVPVINLGEDIEMDYDGLIVLSVNNGFETLWSTGSTDESIIIQGSNLGEGSHEIWVKQTTEANCEASDTINIYVRTANIDIISSHELFTIYPNPSNGNITVKLNNNVDNEELIIYNAIGEELLHNYNINSINYLNLENYNKGIYFIKVFNDKHNIVKKLTLY